MPSVIAGSEKRVGGGSLRKRGSTLIYESRWEFTVLADSKYQSRLDVLATSGLPIIGASTDAVAVCKTLDADRLEENPKYWKVSATFSSEVEESSTGQNSSNINEHPTTWVPVIELTFSTFEEVSEKDADGDPVVNAAKKPFETGIVLQRSLVSCDFDQFESDSITVDELISRNETVNSVEFLGKAIGTMKLQIKRATIGYYYGARVWRINYFLTYNPKGWKDSRLNVGYIWIDTSASPNVEKAEIDEAGNPLLLHLKSDGSWEVTDQLFPPEFIDFDQYASSDFSFIRTA